MSLKPYMDIVWNPIGGPIMLCVGFGLIWYAIKREYARDTDLAPRLWAPPFNEPKKPKIRWFWFWTAGALSAIAITVPIIYTLVYRQTIGQRKIAVASVQTAPIPQAHPIPPLGKDKSTSPTPAEKSSASISFTTKSFHREGNDLVLTWHHGLNTRSPIVSCYTLDGHLFVPADINPKDKNTAIIYVPSPVSGRCSAAR